MKQTESQFLLDEELYICSLDETGIVARQKSNDIFVCEACGDDFEYIVMILEKGTDFLIPSLTYCPVCGK